MQEHRLLATRGSSAHTSCAAAVCVSWLAAGLCVMLPSLRYGSCTHSRLREALWYVSCTHAYGRLSGMVQLPMKINDIRSYLYLCA